ncbi:DUF1573 domain-containing protein [Ferruginibacter sp.]
MKKIFTLLVIACTATAVNAQQNPAPAPAQVAVTDQKAAVPETLVLKETEFNFGKIPQGKPVTHVFEISNSGTDSLRIVNVQASCGCTTPEWERDKPIAPGKTAKITVGYNAMAEGPFTKPVTITYNGSEVKQLFIKGEVWKTPTSSAPENKSLSDLKN